MTITSLSLHYRALPSSVLQSNCWGRLLFLHIYHSSFTSVAKMLLMLWGFHEYHELHRPWLSAERQQKAQFLPATRTFLSHWQENVKMHTRGSAGPQGKTSSWYICFCSLFLWGQKKKLWTHLCISTSSDLQRCLFHHWPVKVSGGRALEERQHEVVGKEQVRAEGGEKLSQKCY